MVSTNSYMFWHQSAIFWESTDTKNQKFIDSMKMALRCQNIGVGPYHELFFVICMLLYFIKCICWYIY